MPDVNLPIIPDKVMDDVRKGRSVPLEAFSEAAADMVGSSAAARKAPVHAENLRPISAGQAKLMVESSAVPGQGLPMLPRTASVIPAPFQRDRINASRHGKTWQTARASTIEEGDIVKGAGLVTETWRQIRYSTRGEVLGTHVSEPDADGIRTASFVTGAGVVLGPSGLIVERPDEPVAVGTDVFFRNAGEETRKCDQDDFVEVFRKAPE